MKKLSIILALALVLPMMFAIPSGAANYTMLKGTPEIDGAIDEIYLQSASYTMTTANQVYKKGAEYSDCPEFKATSYFLYDDKYVYVATEVTDATILSAGADKVKAGYVWENDVCEHWISLDGGKVWGQFNYDAFDTAIGEGREATYAKKGVAEGSAFIDGNKYVVEVKFPHEGKKAGDTLHISMQINNLMAQDASKLVCIGKQKGTEYLFELSAKETVAPQKTPEKAPTAAATADPFMAVMLLTMSAAGIAVSRKRK